MLPGRDMSFQGHIVTTHPLMCPDTFSLAQHDRNFQNNLSPKHEQADHTLYTHWIPQCCYWLLSLIISKFKHTTLIFCILCRLLSTFFGCKQGKRLLFYTGSLFTVLLCDLQINLRPLYLSRVEKIASHVTKLKRQRHLTDLKVTAMDNFWSF